MIRRFWNVVTSRTALVIYLLYLQVGHIYNTWFDYDPPIGIELYCLNTKLDTKIVLTSSLAGVRPERITARRVTCAFSNRKPTVYVYIGLVGDPERSWDVAFRYRGADPTIVQEAADRIRITVDGPGEISKQLARLDAVDIVYTLNPQAPDAPALTPPQP